MVTILIVVGILYNVCIVPFLTLYALVLGPSCTFFLIDYMP